LGSSEPSVNRKAMGAGPRIRVSGPCRLGHVVLSLLPCGETFDVGGDADGMRFCFFSRCIDPWSMTQTYRIIENSVTFSQERLKA